jgi:N-acetylmuramic acid 6-phosphate etherase
VPLVTGPEIIAGSTRLKAATATKLALNMFSTATMIRLGRVHDGLMVDLVPSNRKLVKRAEGIIMEITGCSKEEAARYLKRSGMRPKVAAVMLRKGVSRRKAEEILEDAGGFLRKALR